ncbi:hypothetical protein GGF41_002855 [Coemansia sp. RSA 2531]|nr:hypothetical protein GGF41_002855 [Coemansia sp. RSA 2531]
MVRVSDITRSDASRKCDAMTVSSINSVTEQLLDRVANRCCVDRVLSYDTTNAELKLVRNTIYVNTQLSKHLIENNSQPIDKDEASMPLTMPNTQTI